MPTAVHDYMTFIELMALGLGVGFLTGLFGVGGGFIATPVMISLMGIDASVAVGSSLGFALGASAFGLRRHLRMGNFEPRSSALVGTGSAIGTVIGYLIHRQTARAAGDSFEWYISLAFAILLGIIALVIALTADRVAEPKSPLSKLPIGPYIAIPKIGLARMSVSGLLLAGILTGVLGGFFGIGGGVILIPLLILVVGLTPHLAVGTSLGAVLLGSAVGCGLYAFGSAAVNWQIIAALVLGSWVGTILGAKLCRWLHAEYLHRLLAAVIGIAAVAILIGVWLDAPMSRS
jgi:uncharacterized membrane protein YfcA